MKLNKNTLNNIFILSWTICVCNQLLAFTHWNRNTYGDKKERSQPRKYESSTLLTF